MNATRHRFCGLAVLATVLSVIAGCTSDPAVKKQQYLESGNRYVAESKFAEAIIEYRNAVSIDATFGEARKRLAEAYAKTGDTGMALEEYIRAADLLPQDFDVQLTAGSYLLAARKAEDALGRADAAVKLQPTNPQAHLLRGNALAGLSSFDEALKAVEGAIRLDPGQGSAYTNLGLVQLARGRRDEAEAAFKQAVSLSPKAVEPHLALGNYYWAVGRAPDAERAFAEALAIEPAHPGANRIMAALAFATGRRAEAEPYLRRIADSSTDPDATLTLVDYYLATGRPTEAVSRLEGLVAKGAKMPNLALQLARAQAAAGDRTKARVLVDEVLAANPGDVNAQLFKGQLLQADGRRDEAFAAVRSAATADPSSADAQFALGRMYAARGDTTAAEVAFRDVLKLNPRAAAAQVELAKLQLSAGNPAASIRTAEEATRSQPANVSARLMLVRSLLAAKDFARAEREITALRTAYPKAAVVHVQAATLALLRNDVAGARTALEKAQALDPRSIDVLAGQIAVDLKGNNVSAAKARIEKRLQEGTTPELLMIAARTYWSANDLGAAEKSLRAAIDADPAMLQPYGMLGQLYMRQKKLDQARAEFEALASKQVKPVGALTMSGMILQAQGNVSEARKRFEDVLAIDSRAVIAANNLAWIHAESGDNLDTALQLAQTATAAAPDVPELMDTLGWVYYKKQLPQLAIPIFARCVEKAPSNAGYHYHLGLAYVQAGDERRGREALEQALKAGADGTVAADIRRLLANTRGK